MKIRKIDKKKEWENFTLGCEEKTFLHSWNWGKFNEEMGHKIWRVAIMKKKRIVAVCLIVKIKARRATFLYCPHGPILRKEDQKEKRAVLDVLLKHLKDIARAEKAHFIRFSPIFEQSEGNNRVFEEAGFKDAPIHMHAELTWELNIEEEEEMLLKHMRKTTRYLIRKALREKEIEVSQSRDFQDVETFDKLYGKTVGRHHFVPFSLDYLKKEVSAFGEDNQISVFVARYKGEPIASAIIVFWQGTAYYHHGASSIKHSKIPAAYLLQWEVIKEAKRRRCKLYNFWGIAPEDNPNHPWKGLSLFKKGFGGYVKEFVKTKDVPLALRYWLSFLIEKQRKRKRRL